MEGAARRPGRGEARAEAVALPVTVLPPARHVLRAWRRRARAVASLSRRRWHRSIQLRVIGTTLVISVAVVAILGFFLVQQITSGLLSSERRVALAQTSNGLIAAQGALEAARNSGSRAQTLISVAEALQAGSSPGEQYDVVILQESRSSSLVGVRGNRAIAESLPQSLKKAVSTEQGEGRWDRLFYAPTRITSVSGTAGPPALAVGAPISSDAQLYYLFPLTPQEGSLRLVQTTLFGAGAALVLLLALIVSLVTRWVVVPIRQAAQAASRLSAGYLSERMPVRGTDDLAALAKSFNEMAASLEEKLRELEELSKVQRQFVSDVSHELRTPLTTVRIAADVLYEARRQLDASAGRSAELLQGQLERFEALLADLLEISRYDANAVTLDAESADVCDLVRRAAADAEQLAARLGTRLDFRLPPAPCFAEVDRRRVERVLRNLLDNAVEHGEGRDVVVTVASDRDAVAVAVRDHGVGLSAGEQQLVFDRFWRADPARARATGGTGLGLAIALEDTRLHGGWLQAWGELGKGSVFRLTLPRKAGRELAGSPLPLGPDEAEVAEAEVAVAAVGVLGAGPAAVVRAVAGDSVVTGADVRGPGRDGSGNGADRAGARVPQTAECPVSEPGGPGGTDATGG